VRSGFSLLEMLVVLFMIGVLSVIAFPRANHFFYRAKAKEVQSRVFEAIEVAQTEVRFSHQPVILCRTNDLHTCVKDGISGFLVVRQGVMNIVRAVLPINLSGATLFWRSFPYYREDLLFSLEGNDNGTFWYCVPGEKLPVWVIAINKLGRAHVLTHEEGLDSLKCPGKTEPRL